MSDKQRAVVLVEGTSDRVAVEAMAVRRGRNLAAEGIAVVAIGGAKNIRKSLDRFGPRGLNLRVAGLCDEGEQRDFCRGLERAGFGANIDREAMEQLGFHVCEVDLEDELIRSLGAARVEQVVEEQGELSSFRTLQKQPAQQGRSVEAQLRRFMGTRGGRKIRYAQFLVDALELQRVPPPLERLLADLHSRP
jgi:hypothetical protein